MLQQHHLSYKKRDKKQQKKKEEQTERVFRLIEHYYGTSIYGSHDDNAAHPRSAML